MSEMPSEYDYDYLVYSLSPTILDEPKVWDTEYLVCVKRMMFKQFDNYVDYNLMEQPKDG